MHYQDPIIKRTDWRRIRVERGFAHCVFSFFFVREGESLPSVNRSHKNVNPAPGAHTAKATAMPTPAVAARSPVGLAAALPEAFAPVMMARPVVHDTN